MKNKKQNFATIVLAAGEGRRMKSEKSKVLHQIAGKPMIERTAEILEELNPQQIIIVANTGNEPYLKELLGKRVKCVIQKSALGTADATKIGLKSTIDNIQNVAVLYGDDTAFYKSSTIQKVFDKHIAIDAEITFVTLEKDNPKGLGRVVRKGGKLISITEEKDATEDQKKIKEVNDGLYFFKKKYLEDQLPKLKPSTATGELYVTDLIELALKNRDLVETYKLEDESEWHGINSPIELAKANLRLDKSIHFMGVCGSGASAVASIAKEFGFNVEGCDKNIESAYLTNPNFKIKKGHSGDHITGKSVLVVSPAVEILDPQNPEIAEAKKRGIPIITWQEFQGQILQENKFVVAVAGAYGKSTTTALVSKMIADAGRDPTCEIGAKVLEWDTNFRIGKSNLYVCEADEYYNNFLSYSPDIAVILNMDWDHPDFFPTEEKLIESYLGFINNIKNGGILIIQKEALEKIKKEIRADIKIVTIENSYNDSLELIGEFRKENANAALAVAKALKINFESAIKSISNFKGLARRLEYKGELSGVKFYDDYAVQPYTIEKTANALVEKFKGASILLVLEPHTFSRVKTYFKDFAKSLTNIKVNQIFITDVYAAREKGSGKQLSEKLAMQIGKKAAYTGTIEESAEYVRRTLGKYQVVLTMGAGNIYKLYDQVIS